MPLPEGAHTSPLTVFVNTLKLIAAQRRVLMNVLGQADANADWRVFLEDIEMMLTENVVIGLRTPWVRRVAVPVHRAWMAMRSGDGKPKERAVKALEILKQCQDETLRNECVTYIRNRHDFSPDE
jgi:hypothetical protein